MHGVWGMWYEKTMNQWNKLWSFFLLLEVLLRVVSEGVGLLEVHVPQRVVDHAVVRLVRADGEDNVPHERGLAQLPVGHGDIGRGQLGPHRQLARVQLVQNVAVSDHRLLLQVTNKSENIFYFELKENVLYIKKYFLFQENISIP